MPKRAAVPGMELNERTTDDNDETKTYRMAV